MTARKRCASCDTIKSHDEFYKDKSKKDGRASFCSECSKAKSKRRYRVNRDLVREQGKQYRATHKEQIQEYKRQWYQSNIEHVSEKNRHWRRNNKERASENHCSWRKRNRQHLREYWQTWKELNWEKWSSYQKKYKMNHPHIVLNGTNKRRALIGQFTETTKQEWLSLMNEYNWRCFYCDKTLTGKIRSVDHIIPISRNGRHHISNLMPCCRRCNSEKQSIIYPVWRGIMELNKEKLAHFVLRVRSEAKSCAVDLPDGISVDQMFSLLDNIFRTGG